MSTCHGAHVAKTKGRGRLKGKGCRIRKKGGIRVEGFLLRDRNGLDIQLNKKKHNPAKKKKELIKPGASTTGGRISWRLRGRHFVRNTGRHDGLLQKNGRTRPSWDAAPGRKSELNLTGFEKGVSPPTARNWTRGPSVPERERGSHHSSDIIPRKGYARSNPNVLKSYM